MDDEEGWEHAEGKKGAHGCAGHRRKESLAGIAARVRPEETAGIRCRGKEEKCGAQAPQSGRTIRRA